MSSLGGLLNEAFQTGLIDADQFHMVQTVETNEPEPVLLQTPTQNAETNTAPVFTGPLGYELNEAEAADGVTLQAADAEGDTIQFSIDGGADATHFVVDEDTGQISFVTLPDFEAPADADGNNTYVVEVTVSDGTNQHTGTVEVTVTETDPDPVAFEIIAPGPTIPFAPARGFLSAASTGAVMDLGAEDTDGNATDVSFSLFGEDAFFFNIDAANGVITIDDSTFLQGFDAVNPSAGGLSFDGDAIFEIVVLADHVSGTQDTQEIEYFLFMGG